MSLSFHWVPARNGQSAEDILNAFIRTHVVLGTDRQYQASEKDPGWAVCVEYVDASSPSAPSRPPGKDRIDYKEVLDEPTFKIFSALRDWRKERSTREAVPPYVISSNEQLAAIAKARCSSLASLRSIEGLGEAHIAKYGNDILELVHRSLPQSEASKDGPLK